MKALLSLSALALAMAGSAANATVIAEQNFNALDDTATFTNDQVASGSQLTNASSFNVGGPGLDFNTTWIDTRSNGAGPRVGSESGDFIGVNSFGGPNAPDVGSDGAAVNSNFNFEFNDGDGRLDLVFETVDVSGFSSNFLSLDYWIADTGFESTDSFVVSLSDGFSSSVVMSLGEPELEAQSPGDAGNASEWNSLTVDIDALGLGSMLTLTVSVDTNAGAENIFVDNIVFRGAATAVPVPATLALLGLGLLGLRLARR
jgi:hypothetical protein